MAEEAGIGDLPRFKAYNSLSDSVPRINADAAAALLAGGSGTPTVLINGVEFNPRPDSARLSRIIDSILASGR